MSSYRSVVLVKQVPDTSNVTGNAMNENGTVNLFCGWGSAIDIGDVQRIVLGDLVLWEADD